MKKTESQRKNEAHPTYNRSLIYSSAFPGKIFEPFRTRIDSRNYRYVVDWEIDDNDQSEIHSEDRDRNSFYFP